MRGTLQQLNCSQVNYLYYVYCSNQASKHATPIPELTGGAVQTIDCRHAIPWKVDNKYYCAQVQFVICSHDSKELGEREWEALVLLFSLSEVGRQHYLNYRTVVLVVQLYY